MENIKINAETNSHGNKLSSWTNAFHQLFHQQQQSTPPSTKMSYIGRFAKRCLTSAINALEQSAD